MTQVETRDTVDVGEALDRIGDSTSHAIKIVTPNGTGYIRSTPEDSVHDGPYQVNLPIPYIRIRTTLQDVEGGTVTEAIKDSDAARIVSINDTPFSPLGDE